MTKAPLGLEVLPCRALACDISTNKRYSENGHKPFVACCLQHAAKALVGGAARNGASSQERR